MRIEEGIKSRLLRERDYLVIEKFEDTIDAQVPDTSEYITIRRGKAYVFQVQGVERHLKYEPYLLRNSDGSLKGGIAAQTGLEFDRLWDENGEDILRVKDDAWLLYHFSIAVQQPEIRIYPQIPPDVDMGGWEYLVSHQPMPSAGSNYGYVSGREIHNYYDPPATLETIGWRGKERESNRSYNRYGFFNESLDKAIDPIINIFGRGYLVHPVLDDSTKRKIVAGPPAGPARTLVSLGPIGSPFSLPVPTDWDISHCYVEIEGATLPQEFAEE